MTLKGLGLPLHRPCWQEGCAFQIRIYAEDSNVQVALLEPCATDISAMDCVTECPYKSVLFLPTGSGVGYLELNSVRLT